MKKISPFFLLLGTVAIAMASASLLMKPVMSPFVPMPIYLVLLFLFTSFGFIFFLPVLYVLELLILEKSKNAGRLVFIFSITIFMLDMAYFSSSWKYGLRYQGQYHTTLVFIENLVGFSTVVVLSHLGIRRSSTFYQQSANLLLFVLLAWCAFPYLGELP